jgi:uncharacterized RDD family membrane protein YckC
MTLAAQTGSVHYAGFWRRVLAFIIDAIILSIAGGVINFALTLIFGLFGLAIDPKTMDANDPATQRTVMILGYAILGTMVPVNVVGQWLYFALMESSAAQATLGKMVLQLKVTDLDGRRVGFSRATGRYFAKFLSALLILIGYIMAGLTARKQALHDIIAGCLVIRDPA